MYRIGEGPYLSRASGFGRNLTELRDWRRMSGSFNILQALRKVLQFWKRCDKNANKTSRALESEAKRGGSKNIAKS